MRTNKLLKLFAISAVIFGAVSCKDEVASVGQKAPDIAAYDLQGKSCKPWELERHTIISFFGQKPVDIVLQS